MQLFYINRGLSIFDGLVKINIKKPFIKHLTYYAANHALIMILCIANHAPSNTLNHAHETRVNSDPLTSPCLKVVNSPRLITLFGIIAESLSADLSRFRYN